MSNVLWGLVFIIVGLIWGLNVLDIIKVNLFFRGWWTLFIIIPSLISLFNSKKKSKVSSVFWLAIGIFLLLASWGIFSYDLLFKLFIPFILVFIGIYLMFFDWFRRDKISRVDEGKLDSIVATFSKEDVKKDDSFNGAKVDAIFGSVVLDLRDSKISGDVVIKASSIFGGVDIIIPSGVNVEVRSTSIFGGVSRKIKNDSNNKKVIYIEAFCMFGGVDIK